MKHIQVSYSGEYPTLCFGEWTIEVDAVKLTYKEHMGTHGNYSSWSFGEDYMEEWDSYKDGLKFKDWIKIGRGKEIVSDLAQHDIVLTNDELRDLFDKVQENDWRSSSCGGCI